MGEVRRIDIALDEDMDAEIAAAVERGDYPDINAVVDEALCQWQDNRVINGLIDRVGTDRLRALWEEGLASGEPVDGNFDWEDVKRRGRERLAQLRGG